ncbi:MAG: ATP-binding cassette domain-containing protein, partial [Asgard group archaeon]|nr:ATP-binding cassette domain-containing protein [Asgard group archaeon]
MQNQKNSSANNEVCILEMKNVCYTVNSKTILKNITINFEKDGITGIIGPSGSGKSSLLFLLNRLHTPSKGTIFFQGKDYTEFETRKLRKEIGMLQQRPHLFPGTVKENISYGPNIWNIHYTEEDYINLLEKVALSKEFLERNVEKLSEGEKQRVNLARTLANNPCVLLLDEPTSALDIASESII